MPQQPVSNTRITNKRAREDDRADSSMTRPTAQEPQGQEIPMALLEQFITWIHSSEPIQQTRASRRQSRTLPTVHGRIDALKGHAKKINALNVEIDCGQDPANQQNAKKQRLDEIQAISQQACKLARSAGRVHDIELNNQHLDTAMHSYQVSAAVRRRKDLDNLHHSLETTERAMGDKYGRRDMEKMVELLNDSQGLLHEINKKLNSEQLLVWINKSSELCPKLKEIILRNGGSIGV